MTAISRAEAISGLLYEAVAVILNRSPVPAPCAPERWSLKNGLASGERP